MSDFNEKIVSEFRAAGGTSETFGDAPLVLLTTIGAKSGQPRLSPMMYLADSEDPNRIYVFASKAGADTNPAWYHNLQANPGVTVEIGTETVPATASVLPEERRATVYAEQAELYPGFAEYALKTTRRIPVVALDLQR